MKLDLEASNRCQEAYKKIKGASNILLVAHERPDGDAVSCLGAMIDLCEQSGKNYLAFCSGAPINQYSFLPHIEKVIFQPDYFGAPLSVVTAKSDFKNFDLIIIFDCGSLARTGLAKKIRGRTESQFVIEFDHHPKNDEFSNLEIRNPEAVAATEILYYFFKVNKIKISKNIANCILTGILTDTGNFLYPLTSCEAVGIASEMLVHGANFQHIIKNIIHNKSLAGMKLWGLALSNLRINKKYNFAFSVLTLEEIDQFGANEDIFDSISGFLSNLYGVKGVMFLREEKDGRLKGSLRSAHPTIDVSKLAGMLGGGGHVKASGFVLDGKIEKAGEGWRIT